MPRLRSLVPDCTKRSSGIRTYTSMLLLNRYLTRVNTAVFGDYDGAQRLGSFLNMSLAVDNHIVVPILLRQLVASVFQPAFKFIRRFGVAIDKPGCQVLY